MNRHKLSKMTLVGLAALALSVTVAHEAYGAQATLAPVVSKASASFSTVHHMTWPANTACGSYMAQ